MFNSSREIARLQADLKALKEERESFFSKNSTLKNEAVAENLVLKEQLEEANARIKELEGGSTSRISALETEKNNLATELTTLKADFDKKVEARAQDVVIDRCASAGVEPVQRGNGAHLEPAAGGDTLTRQAFESLSPGEARQFIREGGRVTR
jgi:predicted nuclease with TOPRIM domain